jgi:hypothetical protein
MMHGTMNLKVQYVLGVSNRYCKDEQTFKKRTVALFAFLLYVVQKPSTSIDYWGNEETSPLPNPSVWRQGKPPSLPTPKADHVDTVDSAGESGNICYRASINVRYVRKRYK